MDKRDEFVQIAPEYFLKGMYVDSDVFYIQNSRPVLFCKQTVINNEKLLKLKQIAEEKAPIFIARGSYDLLIKQYDYYKKMNDKMAVQYNEIKDGVFKQISGIKMDGKVAFREAEKLSQTVEETLSHVELMYILQWIGFMRDTDEYLCTHSVNVAMLNGLLGEWLNFSVANQKKLIIIGLLHDVGKAQIEDEIINKPDKLTKEEFEVIKQHPLFSHQILQNSGVSDNDILAGVRGHHEKGNGNGYPDKLSLNEISIFARVTAISDIYDALLAKRVYKKAQSPFEALNEFYKNKFSDLDIRLVDIFLDRMINDMIGKEAVLSNGKTAQIVYMEKNNILYPVVKCGEEIINTTKSLKCESICINLAEQNSFRNVSAIYK